MVFIVEGTEVLTDSLAQGERGRGWAPGLPGSKVMSVLHPSWSQETSISSGHSGAEPIGSSSRSLTTNDLPAPSTLLKVEYLV